MATKFSFLFMCMINIGENEQTRILENMNPLTSWLRSSMRGSSKVTPVTHNCISKGVIHIQLSVSKLDSFQTWKLNSW